MTQSEGESEGESGSEGDSGSALKLREKAIAQKPRKTDTYHFTLLSA